MQIREGKLSDLFTAADGRQVGRFCSQRHRLKAREESFPAMCLRPQDSATLSNALDRRIVGLREFVTDR